MIDPMQPFQSMPGALPTSGINPSLLLGLLGSPMSELSGPAALGAVGGFGGPGGFGGSPFGQGGAGQQNPVMMEMVQMLLSQMVNMLQSAGGGMGAPGGGMPELGMQGMGMPGMGMPGMGIPGMGMPGMGMPEGGIPGMGAGMNGAGGGPVELQKGQSYTTPSGSTISWQGDKVDVHESGGGQQMGGGQQTMGGGGGGSFAGAVSGPGYNLAVAGNIGGQPGCPMGGQGQGQPENWDVFGDPHIQNPDGSRGEFKDGAQGAQNNGMFNLQDGTRVVMEAGAANTPVTKVLIYPPGSQLQGFDPNTTTNWVQQNGKFNPTGTVAQSMGMGMGMGGMNPQGMF